MRAHMLADGSPSTMSIPGPVDARGAAVRISAPLLPQDIFRAPAPEQPEQPEGHPAPAAPDAVRDGGSLGCSNLLEP
eukprot:306563-Pyramimonas_sp.AAC.1